MTETETKPAGIEEAAEQFRARFRQLKDEVQKVIIGGLTLLVILMGLFPDKLINILG